MGADVEIKISTLAELSGAKAVEASLEKQIGAAKAMGKDFADLEKQLVRLRAVIAGAEVPGGQSFLGKLGGQARELAAQVPGLQGVLQVVTSLASGPLGVISAGLAAIAVAGKTAAAALTEFAAAEQAVAGLDSALARTGQLSDENREKTQALAAALQEATGVADDQWIAALQRLVQFGSQVNGTLEKDADAVKNLAGLMDGNLTAAADAVSRAMAGNFEAFRRFGIQLDEHLTQTEKLDRLYQELAQRGGGQLEARARTLSGQWETLKNNTGDLLEAGGRLIAQTGVLQGVMRAGADTAQFWAEVLGGIVPQVDGLENAARRTATAFDEGSTAARDQASAIAEIAREAGSATDALDKMLAKIRETKSREDRKDAAMKDVELARIDAAVQQGRANPMQAAGAKAEVELRYSARAQAREEQAIESQRSAISREMERRAEQERTLEGAVKQERGKATAAEQRATEVASLQRMEAEEDRLKKEMERLLRYNSFQIDPGAQRSQAEVGDQLANAVKLAGLQRRKVAGIPDVMADVAGAESALKAARQANDPFFRLSTDRLSALDEEQASGREVFGLRQQARQVRGATAIGGAFQGAAGAVTGKEVAGVGDEVARQQAALAGEFVSALRAIGHTTESAIRELRREVSDINKRAAGRPAPIK